MDVVNFAHGEFLMLAMYATFGLVFVTALDPVVLAPLVVALMFVLGVSVYAGIIRYAMRAKANPGMVQIFATFGLALLIQGLAQYFFNAGLSQHCQYMARRQDAQPRRRVPAVAADFRRARSRWRCSPDSIG